MKFSINRTPQRPEEGKEYHHSATFLQQGNKRKQKIVAGGGAQVYTGQIAGTSVGKFETKINKFNIITFSPAVWILHYTLDGAVTRNMIAAM